MQAANPTKALAQWNFVMLDSESKVRFYLSIPSEVKNYPVPGERDQQTSASLLKAWPFLAVANDKTDTIYISRKQYEKSLQAILTHYTVIEAKPTYGERFFKQHAKLVIAFVPKNPHF